MSDYRIPDDLPKKGEFINKLIIKMTDDAIEHGKEFQPPCFTRYFRWYESLGRWGEISQTDYHFLFFIESSFADTCSHPFFLVKIDPPPPPFPPAGDNFDPVVVS